MQFHTCLLITTYMSYSEVKRHTGDCTVIQLRQYKAMLCGLLSFAVQKIFVYLSKFAVRKGQRITTLFLQFLIPFASCHPATEQ